MFEFFNNFIRRHFKKNTNVEEKSDAPDQSSPTVLFFAEKSDKSDFEEEALTPPVAILHTDIDDASISQEVKNLETDGLFHAFKESGHHASILVHPVDDVVVDEGADSTSIELSSVFHEFNVPANEGHLSIAIVGNSDASLVNPRIQRNRLTLDYLPYQSGSSTITLRATDSDGNLTDTSFDVTVNPLTYSGAWAEHDWMLSRSLRKKSKIEVVFDRVASNAGIAFFDFFKSRNDDGNSKKARRS